MRGKLSVMILMALMTLGLTTSQAVHAAPISCEEPVASAAGLVKGAADAESATCSWKGVPYAAPPEGELRWKAPQPVPSWEGARETVHYGNRCWQKGMMNSLEGKSGPGMSEDCLYLNVWRPREAGVYPVMVWIHGGGYTGGTGATPMYIGDRLSENGGLVVVTINYRLNAFGFLAHEQFREEDPHQAVGGYGSLDQVAALQWVHDNIAHFGGDPDRVTIFGESAGGWSVCTMLATPLARGLFQGAILESGGCEASHTLEEGFGRGRKAAKKLGCAEDDVACMRSRPAEEVLEKMMPEGLLAFPFMPHEDSYLLTGTPLRMIQAGNFNNVAFIAGSNRDEVSKVAALLKPRTYHDRARTYEKGIRKFAPDADPARLMALYPLSQYGKPRYAYAQMFTDRALGCPTYEGMEAVAARQPQTYYYRFDYDRFRFGQTIGAIHAMELPFVFGNLDRKPINLLYNTPARVAEAQPLARIIQGYWINFAKTGNPNSEGLPAWPRFRLDDTKVQVLDVNVTTETPALADRCQLWADYGQSYPALMENVLKAAEKK